MERDNNSGLLSALTVELSDLELGIALHIGAERNQPHTPSATLRQDVQAVAAELAFCKFRNVYPLGALNFCAEDDARAGSTGIEVRHTIHARGRLLSEKGFDRSKSYVLVTGSGKTFTMRGYITGPETKDVEYYWEDAPKYPCWAIDQSQLSHDWWNL